ncbi:MAG: type 4a pilus biogenesis protein PilO [Deltaproteobacteria bacterium]|nr:type 4a pilus biogenesis protein PilO [Deltaproteobacteria bacterium]MBW1996018.1 type 4a pilus biogenesis protein PilO [Deltaproteobacteria bacterium]
MKRRKMADVSGKIFDPLIEAAQRLSNPQRLAVCVGAFALLIGGFAYFSFLPKLAQIDQLKNDIEAKERQLMIATRKASQLRRYREMKKKAEADFRIAKKALPDRKEIPSLLTGISRAGKDAGLEFLLFQPKAEIKKDFYAEIPVSIKVSGSYHNIAIFFDKVSRLFRVVNIRDITMTSKNGTSDLDTSCTAITYRFIEPKPKTGKTTAKSKKGKRK